MKQIRSEFAALCRQFGHQALATQAEIMNNPKASESSRLRASSLLMAYGYGQPVNNIDVSVSGDKEESETPEQKKFRETMEKAASAATSSMRSPPPVLARPDPARDGAIPEAEVFGPAELTPAEQRGAASTEGAARLEPDARGLALGVALGASLKL